MYNKEFEKINKPNLIYYFIEIPNFLTIFICSYFYSMQSILLLETSNRIGVTVGKLGLIFTFTYFGNNVGLISLNFLRRKIKNFHILLISYISLIILITLINFVKNLFLLYLLYFFIGYCWGCIWGIANIYLVENKIKNKARLLNIAHSFYPLGAIVAPIVVSFVVNKDFDYKLASILLILIIFIIVVFYLINEKKIKRDNKILQKELYSFKEIFVDKNKNILFILTIILSIFYGIAEGLMISWVPTFLRVEKLFSITSATFAISIFWAALLIGRLVISKFAKKENINQIIILLSIISIITFILIIYSNYKYTIFIMFFLAGLGFSGISPLTVAFGSTIYEKARGTLTTIVFLSIGIGLSAAPLIMSFTIKYGYLLSMSIPVFAMFLIVIVSLITICYKRKFLQLITSIAFPI